MIVHQINVLPVQNRLPVLLSVNHHIFVEKTMHSEIVEGHLALNEFQMFLKVCSQGLGNPPTTYAHAPIGIEWFTLLANIYSDFIVIGHFYDSPWPLEFILKTLALLLLTAGLQSLFARLRIDQTVGLWWRIGAIVALVQLLAILAGQALQGIL